MTDSIRSEVFFRIVRPKIWFLRIKEHLEKVPPDNEKSGRTIPLDFFWIIFFHTISIPLDNHILLRNSAPSIDLIRSRMMKIYLFLWIHNSNLKTLFVIIRSDAKWSIINLTRKSFKNTLLRNLAYIWNK